MNQELDDECSLHELPIRPWVDNSPSEEDVEYFTDPEKAVLYIVLSVLCVLCLWGAWKFAKSVWHGLVWLVAQ